VIKMYAWEKPFSKVVELARRKEIQVIRYVSYIRGILLSFIVFTSRVSTFCSLVMFALLGNVVNAQQAFVITAYYNVLRQTMTVFFPQAIGMLAEMNVSVGRLEKFMMYDELDRDFQNDSKKKDEKNESESKKASNGTAPVDPAVLQEPGIIMEKVCCQWNPESPDLTLSNINLRVQPTTTVAVIGMVGSSKSSLIQAILGELPIQSGRIRVNGTIAYAAQEPWLFSASIRQNILFGEPMDKDRYRTVIKACSLTRDIELWPEGDKTIVGERGMSLSGGQKARINLARAVYRKADIYLLDDPLSAVDAHVGRHLFDSCINGFLRDKIVVLVTHQLQYLPNVDEIVLLDHGSIEKVGTYEILQDSGLDFTKLLPRRHDMENRRTISRSLAIKSIESMVSSRFSTQSQDYDEPKQQEEKRAGGATRLFFYKAYMKAAGGCLVLSIVFLYLLAQAAASLGDYFINYWVTKEASRLHNTSMGFADRPEPIVMQALDVVEGTIDDRNVDIYIFSALIVTTILITILRSFMSVNLAMKTSKRLHDAMFYGVTRATMHFFNTNLSGRILNRFSRDMAQIDEILPTIMIEVLQIFLSVVGSFILIALVNPLLLVPTAIVTTLFYFLRQLFLKSSRNLKRMEATSK